jgi:hypothetical protein
MPSSADEEDLDAGRLIETGAQFLGGAAGGALGTLGGPPGVILGAAGGTAVSHAVTRVGSAIFRRNLEERQAGRAGAAFGVAVERIRARLLSGTDPRDDGFISKSDSSSARSAGEELLEGTLRAAADEHEEKKVPFLGAFWGNLVFSPQISRAYANYLLRLAEGLTWRQFVLLADAGSSLDDQVKQALGQLDAEVDVSAGDPGVFNELEELAGLGLVAKAKMSRLASMESDEWDAGLTGFADSRAAPPELAPMGRDLYGLLDLGQMPQDELHEVGESLRAARRWLRSRNETY